jgi:cell wall-associated NlpC family hydrolase
VSAPFYNSFDRILALQFHAAELVDTPFVKYAMVPGTGGGIDCVHVNAWCYLKTGFLKNFAPPKYALDSGSHSKESALLKWLNAHAGFKRLELPDFNIVLPPLRAGDTICFNLGLSEHHVALMLGGDAYVHVLSQTGRRVIISSLEKESYYRRHVTAVFRPLDLQPSAFSLQPL